MAITLKSVGEKTLAKPRVKVPKGSTLPPPPDPVIDLDNKQPRCMVQIALDTSISLKKFIAAQFESCDEMLRSLADDPVTKNLMVSFTQINSVPRSTGLRDIHLAKPPVVELADGSQIHRLTDSLTLEIESAHSFLRSRGLDTQRGAAIFAFDGDYNGLEENLEELVDESIVRFHQVCNARGIDVFLVALGDEIKLDNLKRLTIKQPVLTPEKLTGKVLVDLIRSVAIQASTSRRDREIQFETPVGFKILD